MYGKIKNELIRLGLNCNGNRYYGALFGYETNVNINNFVYVNVSLFRTPEIQTAIQQDLVHLKTNFINWTWNRYGLTFMINGWTQGTIARKLESQLKSFYDIFAKHGALGVGYCPVCGNELDLENTKKCLIDGYTISIDNNCVEQINIAIEQENKDFEAAPNNYLKGFFGALVGGVAGAVVAIILYLIGFVSAISTFVAFFVGVYLYKKFGGKPNKMMLVIVTVTTFACMILSVLGIYIAACAAEAALEGLDISGIEAFKLLMQYDEEFARSFWADMAMTVLFTVVGCVLEIVNHSRKIKRQKNI